jgi:hypothetical protein
MSLELRPGPARDQGLRERFSRHVWIVILHSPGRSRLHSGALRSLSVGTARPSRRDHRESAGAEAEPGRGRAAISRALQRLSRAQRRGELADGGAGAGGAGCVLSRQATR